MRLHQQVAVDIQSAPEKMHKVQCTVILQPIAVELRGFHQNAQKLTVNTKNWQIFNIVIKYFLFGRWLGNYLKASMSDVSC